MKFSHISLICSLLPVASTNNNDDDDDCKCGKGLLNQYLILGLIILTLVVIYYIFIYILFLFPLTVASTSDDDDDDCKCGKGLLNQYLILGLIIWLLILTLVVILLLVLITTRHKEYVKQREVQRNWDAMREEKWREYTLSNDRMSHFSHWLMIWTWDLCAFEICVKKTILCTNIEMSVWVCFEWL